LGKRGYNEGEVDALLNEIAVTIENLDHRYK
jgi:DivIVA domain-containing protein